jgi:hypothetical protein
MQNGQCPDGDAQPAQWPHFPRREPKPVPALAEFFREIIHR